MQFHSLTFGRGRGGKTYPCWWAMPLLGALLVGGCASNRQFQHPSGAVEKSTAQGGSFDPVSLREDLLLIQPNFDRPQVSRADTAAESQGAQTSLPKETLPSVYRLQIIAFKTEDLARQRAAALQSMLGVPVRVVAVPERGLFMVQAGEYQTAEEAEALCERLVALNADYAEAYVIPRTGRGRPAAAAGVAVEAATSFSGWRVLIDQFLSYEEAEQLRQEAADRLQRTDVEINFKAPWFKVEVGRFRREAMAQELVELIQSCGYRNVLKVREKIEVQEARP
ncbi:MAG: SPOR domain-containing protein [Candidatus Latescibacteria bacterium]|nr:SPOR domain-containing protein [Candidatus Latescibacterota bacterium]